MEQIKTSDLYDLGVGSRSKQWRLEKMLVMCSAVRQLAEVNQTLVLFINPAKMRDFKNRYLLHGTKRWQ